jgi:hypothetical protein
MQEKHVVYRGIHIHSAIRLPSHRKHPKDGRRISQETALTVIRKGRTANQQNGSRRGKRCFVAQQLTTVTAFSRHVSPEEYTGQNNQNLPSDRCVGHSSSHKFIQNHRRLHEIIKHAGRSTKGTRTTSDDAQNNNDGYAK